MVACNKQQQENSLLTLELWSTPSLFGFDAVAGSTVFKALAKSTGGRLWHGRFFFVGGSVGERLQRAT
jgi:hypothetical protein